MHNNKLFWYLRWMPVSICGWIPRFDGSGSAVKWMEKANKEARTHHSFKIDKECTFAVYFSIEMDAGSNLRLIPQFDSAGSVVTCQQTVQSEETRTQIDKGCPFVIYQQLKDKEKVDADKIKTALYTAFTTDKFAAYEQKGVGVIYMCLNGGDPVMVDS